MNKEEKEKTKWIGYQFTIKQTKNGVLKEIWQDCQNNDPNHKGNEWVKISSSIVNEKNWSKPPSDHIYPKPRDDLGLCDLIDNFDKVKEKFKKGQKEVYQDGWSIKELNNKNE